MLDAGAGDAPYRNEFSHTRYESADFHQVDKIYAQSTYVCDLAAIPVEDARFEFIVFNQVMEHLPDPANVLRELHRVLQPGGQVLYTGPLFYEEHEQPYDFYRYTQFGVRFLFESAGFRIHRLDWLEGYFGTVAYQLNRMFHFLPSRPADLAPGVLGYILSPLLLSLRVAFAGLSVFFHWLETRSKVTRRGYPKNYVALLTKPVN